MNAPTAATDTGTGSPLWELTLARMRLFFREPGAVFWTFGFPLLLSIALGIAFRNQPAAPSAVAVVSAELQRGLSGEPQLHTRILGEGAAREALRTVMLFVVLV